MMSFEILCTFGNVLLLVVAYNLLRALSNFDIAQFSANKSGQGTLIESRGNPDLIIVSHSLSDDLVEWYEWFDT